MVIVTSKGSLEKLEKKVFDPQWLRPVLDDVSDGFLLETGERIVYINNAYASFLLYRPHEVVTRDVSFFIAPDDAPRLLFYSRKRAKNETAPRNYDFVARRKDESHIRLDATISVSFVDHRMMIAAIARPAAEQHAGDEIADPRRDSLSVRELEVMEAILAGKRVKEIACDLNVDAKTVATHRSRMLKKLEIADNRELFRYAVRHRLVDWR